MYKIRNWGNTLKKELKGMKSTKTKKIRREDIPNLETSERVKYEIAEELGLLDKVLEDGWKSLSSKETGRIGGIISKKSRRMRLGIYNNITNFKKCEYIATFVEKALYV